MAMFDADAVLAVGYIVVCPGILFAPWTRDTATDKKNNAEAAGAAEIGARARDRENAEAKEVFLAVKGIPVL
jgi:hypothetical protein